jgi:hypothetical protein
MAHATVNLGGIGLPGFYNPFHKGKRGFHRVCVCVCEIREFQSARQPHTNTPGPARSCV